MFLLWSSIVLHDSCHCSHLRDNLELLNLSPQLSCSLSVVRTFSLSVSDVAMKYFIYDGIFKNISVAVNTAAILKIGCYLCVRLNAMEYQDLRDKLRSPVMNIRNVIIRQSLSERFLDAFKQQIERNEVYRKPSDLVSN